MVIPPEGLHEYALALEHDGELESEIVHHVSRQEQGWRAARGPRGLRWRRLGGKGCHGSRVP